jgi:hypothetical protein
VAAAEPEASHWSAVMSSLADPDKSVIRPPDDDIGRADLGSICADDRLQAEIECPTCLHRRESAVRLTAETSRQAAKRPATPELIQICPNCGCLLVVSLLPFALCPVDPR